MPVDLLVRDDPLRVSLVNYAENGFSVQYVGVRTGALFKVVDKAAGRCVVELAKRTDDICLMNLRVDEVLYMYMSALRSMFQRPRCDQVEGCYHLETVFTLKPSSTGTTIILKVRHSSHV